MATRLYGIFSQPENVEERVSQITSIYSIPSSKVMQFEVGNSDEILLTYEVEDNTKQSLPGSLVLHRNSKYKVMYSINALNHLTGGDKSVKVDWITFSSCLLTTVHKDLQVAKIKLEKIHNI